MIKKILFYFLLAFSLPILIFSLDFILTKLIFKDYHYFKINEKRAPKQQFYRVKNEFYHHGFLPNINVLEENIGFGTYRFVTNSLGFKDSETREVVLKKDKHRILFIGDSFTEGVLLDYEDTFVGIIDNNLKKFDIEVLNAGVGSYYPSIYYNKILYLINNLKLEFDELIVFIDLSDAKDEFSKEIEENKIVYEKKLNLFEKTVRFIKSNFVLTYTLLNLVYDYTKDKYLSDSENFIIHMSEVNTFTTGWTFDEAIYKEYGEFGLQEMKIKMQLLVDLCKKNNIDMTIAVYPWFQQIYNNDFDSIHVKIWKSFSEKNNIDFINFFPFFFSKENSFNENLEIIKKYYIPFDVHFNKLGNKLISDNFLNFYEIKKNNN